MDYSQKTQQHIDPADHTQVAVSPVSSHSKEGGGAMLLSAEKLIEPSMPEMEVSPELQKETGIEATQEIPHLAREVTKAGIMHAKESVPVSTTQDLTIILPMTQQESQQTVKLHKKIKDSVFWFAMLIMRQWQIAEKNKK